MAIATQQIHSGLLAQVRKNLHTNQKFSIVSESTEWFESLAGSGPNDANILSVTIQVEKIVGNSSGEVLHADLYESDDRHEWDHETSLSLAMDSVGAYEEDYPYPGGDPPKKYFKLQFSLDDPDFTDLPALPYPNYTLEFYGTCWTTVSHV